MATKVLVIFALVCAAIALPQYGAPPAPAPGYGAPGGGGQGDQAPAQYNFDWSVKDDESGNDFGHEESRDGDFTQGSYYVLLPDGRMQRVDYTVDGDSGFVAEVSYEDAGGQGGQGGGYQPPRSGYN